MRMTLLLFGLFGQEESLRVHLALQLLLGVA